MNRYLLKTRAQASNCSSNVLDAHSLCESVPVAACFVTIKEHRSLSRSRFSLDALCSVLSIRLSTALVRRPWPAEREPPACFRGILGAAG